MLRPGQWPPLPEERQQGLRRLVGDRHGLDRQLLLNLEGLQTGRGLFHVGVNQRADTGFERVRQVRDELFLGLDPTLRRTKSRRGINRSID